MSSSTKKVPVEEIEMDHRCQARAIVDHDAIEEYAAAYRAGRSLPPPEVFQVSGKLYLVDGFHRVPAAITAGVGFLRVAIVGQGTLDDAIWYATGVNASHGVRRSNADKRRAVQMALALRADESDRAIAAHCSVSHTFVATVRRELEAAQVATVATSAGGRVDDHPPATRQRAPEKRTGKDGKLYPAKATLDETASRPEPPVTDEAPLPFEPDAPASMPTYGPALAEAAKRVREARLFALRTVPEAPELLGMRQRFEKDMRQAQAALELSTPVACPKCGGPGCPHCSSAGWVPASAVSR